MGRSLTSKQALFVKHYLDTLNATEAASLSGHGSNRNSSAVAGNHLLRNPNVSSKIKAEMDKRTMSTGEIITRLEEQARASLEDFIIESEYSGKVEINLKRAKEGNKLHLLKKFKKNKDGSHEIELHDPQSALEKLAKIHKMFSDEKPQDLNVNITIDGLAKIMDKVYGDKSRKP